MTSKAEKVTQELADHIAASEADQAVDVIIQLQPVDMAVTGSRRDRIEATRQAFQSELEPVAEAIQHANGYIVDSVWLNQTVRAVVPAETVSELATAPGVVQIALPSRIEPDTVIG
ncbi:hypothetical protein ABZ924_33775 [Streptomyces sp. NPDC046876]|uniref:hypothetical protein n=1 Tax=Streptomyces sp. NPDC046876 TaxID=3155616 RepID=UPI0033D85F38